MSDDDAHWAEVRAAMGKGTRSILLGTSSRALNRSLAKVREASERVSACAGGTPDICPQCGEADLEPVGAKHRCPVCLYLQPCCTGPAG